MPHGKKKHNIRIHRYVDGIYSPVIEQFEGELEEAIEFAEKKLVELVAESFKIFDELGALIHQSVQPIPEYSY